MRLKISPKIVMDLAKLAGWSLLDNQPNIGMISFNKGGSRINVYLSKMTVTTCIDHPKQGKTQLFRKNVNESLLKKIFNNPRIHTDKGYQRKK